MNNFLISLSHRASCMYGRGSIRVLKGVVELRTRPLPCLGLQVKRATLLCRGDRRGMRVIDAGVNEWDWQKGIGGVCV